MANLDFPDNPELGQEYKGPKGKSYWWDGIKWSVKRPVIVTQVPEPEPVVVPDPEPEPVIEIASFAVGPGGIDFPPFPVVGFEFLATNGITYIWDGVKWVINQNVIIDTGGDGNTGNYVLPTATNTRLGGVRTGEGIINNNGTIAVDLTSARGPSSQLIGTFDSLSDLQAAYPVPELNYWAFVKDANPNILYIYRPGPNGWVNEDINFPRGEKGEKGDTGDKGETGDTGDTGAQGVSVTLQGTKATIADLPAAPLNANTFAGHGWIVTTGDGLTHQDGSLWFWNLSTRTWNDIGPIVGPQGDRGPRGLPGDAGIIATGEIAGVVKIGNNINIAGDGTISVPVATNSTLGVVKPGTNVTIDGNGAISVSKGAGINTVADIPDVNTTAGGAALNDGALLIYNASSERWDTIKNLRSDEMDGGFF
jgi:hypothetical protein